MRRQRRVTLPGAPVGLGAALLVLASCSTPRILDGHIPNPPPGFAFDANASKARNVFPDREIVWQRGYGTLGEENHCSIFITKFVGTAGSMEIEDARSALAARYPYLEYGPLEELLIDHRPAWGWLETQFYKGELSSLAFKAVVPYDSVCYAVEFFARDPQYRNPEVLKAAVATFEIGRKEVHYSHVALAALFVLGTVLVVSRIGRSS
jgi:hypothetical protein